MQVDVDDGGLHMVINIFRLFLPSVMEALRGGEGSREEF